MSIKKRWLLFLCLIGLLTFLLLAPPTWIEKIFSSSQGSRNHLATEVFGKVEKKAALATHFSSVSNKTSVHHGDTFITHEDSKVLFAFNTPFWLMPFSKIEFVQNEQMWTGNLIYGEIRKIAPGDGTETVELIHDGKIIESEVYSSAQEIIVSELLTSDTQTFKDIAPQENTPQNPIEKQIYQTLLLHKKFFQGCLIKYYKNKSGQIRGGETVFDLLIDVTGAIESARVTRTDIDDSEYIHCLQMIFSRLRFKNFQAKEPLHAIFPLHMQLPEGE